MVMLKLVHRTKLWSDQVNVFSTIATLVLEGVPSGESW